MLIIFELKVIVLSIWYYILDCAYLRSIVIGDNTFTESTSLQIVDNENLVILDVGKKSFGGNSGSADSIFKLSSMILMLLYY